MSPHPNSWEVIPYSPEHVRRLRLQPSQLMALSPEVQPHLENLGLAGLAFTGISRGEVIACAGVAPSGLGSATLWGFISAGAKPYFVRLHRSAERMLRLRPFRRIEASSEVDFEPGCRWLELLGFEAEGVMRAYGPDGKDHMRYAWLSRSR